VPLDVMMAITDNTAEGSGTWLGTITLEDWLSAAEGWSTATRRSIWVWRRAHGWKRVERLEDGKNGRVWLQPDKWLLPKHLGGQAIVLNDKES